MVAEITSASMRGEIDFEQSLRQRVKLLAGVSEADLVRISENFVINDGAAELIDYVHSIGGKACAVSGGFESLLGPIAQNLGSTLTGQITWKLSRAFSQENCYRQSLTLGPSVLL